MIFKDRYHAGLLLSEKLQKYSGEKSSIILSIPRGGVLVAKAISFKLGLPIDVLVTKKIGAPRQKELAIGAVGPEGFVVLDHKIITELEIDAAYIEKEANNVSDEVVKRIVLFSKGIKMQLENRVVILVDDGIATGATVEVAIKFLRAKKVKRLILATPVLPKSTLLKFGSLADELIYLEAPFNFNSVGQYYQNFPQVTDEEVLELLHEAGSGTR